MNTKFRKQFAVIFLTVVAAMFAACGAGNSKLVGTWKRTDKAEEETTTFTAEGDCVIKTPTGLNAAKYELENDNLRIRFMQAKDGKDVNLKIIKLEDNLLVVESESGGKKTQATYEKSESSAAKPKAQENSKPNSQENSKPDVPAAPITEPWASMNLPCQTEGVVVWSDKRRFDCAYGGQKTMERQSEAVAAYTEIFKRDGWKLTSDVSFSKTIYTFEKDGKELFITAKSASISRDGKMHEWKGFGVQANIADKK